MKHDDLARILSLIAFLRSRPRIQSVPGTEDTIRCVTTIARCKTCGQVRLLIIDPEKPETIGFIDEERSSDLVMGILRLSDAAIAERLTRLCGIPFVPDHDCQYGRFFQRQDYLAARFHRALVSETQEQLLRN